MSPIPASGTLPLAELVVLFLFVIAIVVGVRFFLEMLCCCGPLARRPKAQAPAALEKHLETIARELSQIRATLKEHGGGEEEEHQQQQQQQDKSNNPGQE
jgi:hypothetical protein